MRPKNYLIKSFDEIILLPNDMNTQIASAERKINCYFNINDETKFKHQYQYDIV